MFARWCERPPYPASAVRLFVVVMVLVFAAAAAAGRSETGLLHGTVTRGPLTPVCSDARPCYGPAKDVRLIFLRHSRPVARTTTNSDGLYRIRLAAGRYGIRVRSGLRWTPTSVLVRRGSVIRVDISIDTGIR
jgi:hypothetical protein